MKPFRREGDKDKEPKPPILECLGIFIGGDVVLPVIPVDDSRPPEPRVID